MSADDEYFKRLPTTVKGEYGEKLVLEALKSGNKCISVKSNVSEDAHFFDGIVEDYSKRIFYLYEVKTKPYRIKNGRRATGFDLKYVKTYTDWEKIYKSKLVMYFVDEDAGHIYYMGIDELMRRDEDTTDEFAVSFPLIQRGDGCDIIWFDIDNMNILKALSDDEVRLLRSFNKKN